MAHHTPRLGEHSTPSVSIDIPDAGRTPGTHGAPVDNLGHVQQEMDEAVGAMRVVLSKALARDAKVTDLQATAAGLADQSKRFETGAKKLKRRWWWNDKWYLACGLLALVVLVAIVVVPIAVALL